jgi:hypothetical protein
MEDTSVLSSSLSVCDTVRQPKLLNFLKLVDNFDLHLNCPVPNCTVSEGDK